MGRAIVIGGGVGGLAAAIRLARAGQSVRLLERAPTLGGKLRELDVGGHRFPGGPSVLTMRWVFEELFGGAERLAAELRLLPVDPLCRHFFADGTQLDLFTDEERSRAAIERFAGAAAARGYSAYRRHAAKIFEVVRGPFMSQPIPSVFELVSPRKLLQLTQIDALRTLHRALEEFFPDPRLRQLFGRYATYNGSSPYHAPATLSVIVHVENAFGIFAPDGGIYRLAEALQRHARALGVEIETGAAVESLILDGKPGRERVRGVRLRGAELPAELVVANCDVAHVYQQLLGRSGDKLAAKYAGEELSLSAYVLLLAADRAPIDLLHHNVFFSSEYRREFDALVDARRPPADPTVYLCALDRGDPQAAPAAVERLFLLTNAPPLDARGAGVDWTRESARCRDRVLTTLARHHFEPRIHHSAEIAPPDFAARFPSSRGAIYGLASNGMTAAFKRPTNRVPGVTGLYLAGGSVHPGAGLPMVALSAKIAVELALEERQQWE